NSVQFLLSGLLGSKAAALGLTTPSIGVGGQIDNEPPSAARRIFPRRRTCCSDTSLFPISILAHRAPLIGPPCRDAFKFDDGRRPECFCPGQASSPAVCPVTSAAPPAPRDPGVW